MSLALHSRLLIACAALGGGLGVAAGAFGAHALSETLALSNTASVWETAVLYHLIHAVAALAVGLAAAVKTPVRFSASLVRAGWLWLAGTALFSGSLYWLALGGPRILGPVTPTGGVLLLVGWALVAVAALRKESAPR